MVQYLEPLLNNLLKSDLLESLDEIIVVDDGSKDSTQEVLRSLSNHLLQKDFLKIIYNKEPQGRFEARRQGALLAKSEIVFFLDSRISLIPGTAREIMSILNKHSFLMGMTFIDVSKSIFNLYWERTHEWIYRKHYIDVKQGFYLNLENYEKYSKGTGILVVPRANFIKSCDALGTSEVLADDTLLIKDIIRTHPLYVTSQFQFAWEPRQNLSGFLLRLFDRGPGFVQYHFFEHRTRFFYASLLALIFTAIVLMISYLQWYSFFPGIFSILAVGGFSIILVTKSFPEILKLFFLHILVLISFSVGVIYGVLYCLNPFKKTKEITP